MKKVILISVCLIALLSCVFTDEIFAVNDRDDLMISQPRAITRNITIRTNTRIKFGEKGAFVISRGVTLRIENGASLQGVSKQQHIFKGLGAVKFTKSPPEKIYPEWFGVIRGEVNPTVERSNVVAMQKAIDSVFTQKSKTTGHKTGVFYFSDKQTYQFNGTLRAEGRRYLTFTSGTAMGAKLLYTGSGTRPFFALRSAYRITIENLDISYNMDGFTGSLIDFGQLKGEALAGELSGASAYIVIRDNAIKGVASAADNGKPTLGAKLIRFDNSIIAQIERNLFSYGKFAIIGKDGSAFSEVVAIRDNTFVRQGTCSIKNAGSAWNIESNTFEPNYGANVSANFGALCAYTQDNYYAYNVSFNNNWLGDSNLRGVAVKGKFLGGKISNNLFELSKGSTAIELIGGSQGVFIDSNRGNSNAGIVFSGTGRSRGIVISGNDLNVSPIYKVTGTKPVLYQVSGNSSVSNEFSANTIFRGKAAFTQGVNIGRGTPIKKVIKGSARLNFSSLPPNSCEELNIGVKGAADGDVVALGVPGKLARINGTVFSAYVSTRNTVTVKRCNILTVRLPNPNPATVNVAITKF